MTADLAAASAAVSPMGEGAAHQDRKPGGKVARRGRVARMTATVTATAAANRYQQRSATAHNARTIRANLAYARPEKRTVAQPWRNSKPLARPLSVYLSR